MTAAVVHMMDGFFRVLIRFMYGSKPQRAGKRDCANFCSMKFGGIERINGRSK